MHKSVCSILVFCFCTFAGEAQADIFRCTNAEGKKIASDRPIAECLHKTTKVYNNKGQFKAEIAPPLSAEERRKVTEEAERKKAETLAEDERLKEERFLLAHYRNEADVELARKRTLDQIQERKRLATEQLASLDQTISELQSETKNSKKTVNEYASLRQRAEDLSISVKKNRDAINSYDQEIERTNREFDETLVRFRIIIGKTKKAL